jgi:hypothetical protein
MVSKVERTIPTAQATKFTEDIVLETYEGKKKYSKGDWSLMRTDTGETFYLTDSEFKEEFKDPTKPGVKSGLLLETPTVKK